MKTYSLNTRQATSFINKWIWRNRYWDLLPSCFRRDIVTCSSLPRVGGLWAITKFSMDDLRDFCEGELRELCEEEKRAKR